MVYVDSGSGDGSPAHARELGLATIELDSLRPFSAARGRNEGFEEALRLWPETRYVLFLDGDCILDAAFPPAAAAVLEDQSECAIVTGHLAERFPEKSIYNRMCAIEWRSPAGRIADLNGLGGIMIARVTAFRDVGGFNEQAIAGEEPDLGARLALSGQSIFKIDQAMATHDAQMLRFSQWWRRAVRAGHAIGHRYARHGHTKLRDGRRELRSALFWGFALPLLIVLLLWPTHGLSLLLLAGYGYLGWRIYRHYSAAGLSRSDALLMARFITYAKFPEFLGILRYWLNRLRGSFEIIEYK